MTSQRPYASPRRNLADTAASVRLSWSLIGAEYGGGEFRSLEESAELHDLDADAGIDFVQLLPGPERVRRTWSSRFQWGPNWYASFSIRYERPTGRPTEYGKRLAALRVGGLMSDYILQGYLDARPPTGAPIAIGTVPTRDLYAFLDGHEFARKFDRWSTGRQHKIRGDNNLPQPLHWTGYRTLRDGTVFLYVTWDLLAHAGIRVRVHQFRATQTSMFDPVEVSIR